MHLTKIKSFLFLHIALLIYSTGAILAKLASNEEILSVRYNLLYIGVIGILFIYAVFWQQALKRIPLSIAFANKGIAIIYGIIWGALLFDELIRMHMIIGAVFIMFGIYFVVTNHE